MLLRVIILLLCIGLSPIGYAQDIIDHQIIEVDQGLQGRIVHSITRDHYGFFYILGENYMQRWDGQSLHAVDMSDLKYQTQPKPSSQLYTLNTGEVIWLADHPAEDIYMVNHSSESLERVPRFWNDTTQVLCTQGKLIAIEPDSTSTTISSLSLADQSMKEITVIPQSIDLHQVIPLTDRLVYNTPSLEVYTYLYASKSIIPIAQGQIVLSTEGNIIIANDKEIYRYTGGQLKHLTSIDLTNYYLKYLDVDGAGNVIIGHTDSNRRIKKVHLYTTDGVIRPFDQIQSLNDKIIDICADDYRDKLLLGTYNGIYYMHLATDDLRYIHRKQKVNKSEFGYIVSAVCRTTNGDVYFAGESQGLYKYHKDDHSYTQVIGDDRPSYFRGNLKLHYDTTDHKIWSIGYTSSNTSNIYSYDIDSDRVTVQALNFLANDIVPYRPHKVLLIGRQNTKDVAGQNIAKGRIAEYDLRSEELNYLQLLDEDEYPRPRSIYFYDEFAYICTTDGLIIMDRALQGVIKVINSRQNDSDVELTADWMVFVRPFHKYMIIGTNGNGVLVLDPMTLTLVDKLDESKGLSNNVGVSMLTDDQGMAWITSFNGINVIDSNLQRVRTLHLSDGLSDREFYSAAEVESDGLLFFGSNNGMTIINPLTHMAYPPSTQGLYISSVNSSNADNHESQAFYKTDEKIRIPSTNERLTIYIESPDYYRYGTQHATDNLDISVNPFTASYRIENDRIDVYPVPKNLNSIEISRNGIPQVIQIEVWTNWWKEWQWLIYLIGASLLSYFVSRYYIQKNRIYEEEKTAHNKKIAELKLNALKAQMNPHFIFNSLGAIQYFIQTHDTNKADEYLSKFAKLMRLILESSKQDYISLRDEIELIELYVDLEYVRFEGLFEYKIHVDDEVDGDMKIPPMIIQPIVENAINHGLYNLKDRKGKLEINIKSEYYDRLHIRICDNGVGRAYTTARKTSKHKSRASSILTDRVNIINQADEMSVKVSTQDLYDHEKSMGTDVTIDITYLDL